jgi:hypothetical protein
MASKEEEDIFSSHCFLSFFLKQFIADHDGFYIPLCLLKHAARL